MNKILIIGKKSFLGANLRHKLKHNYFIVNQTFEDVFKKMKIISTNILM